MWSEVDIFSTPDDGQLPNIIFLSKFLHIIRFILSLSLSLSIRTRKSKPEYVSNITITFITFFNEIRAHFENTIGQGPGTNAPAVYGHCFLCYAATKREIIKNKESRRTRRKEAVTHVRAQFRCLSAESKGDQEEPLWMQPVAQPSSCVTSPVSLCRHKIAWNLDRGLCCWQADSWRRQPNYCVKVWQGSPYQGHDRAFFSPRIALRTNSLNSFHFLHSLVQAVLFFYL